MSNLRDTLLEVQKEKTLKLLLGNEGYNNASAEEKERYLSVLGDKIERDVDLLLHNHVMNYQHNTPEKKKWKKLRIAYTIANVVLALIGAYAINNEDWVYVIMIGIFMALNQMLPYIFGE